jgi:hypothetical protein
MASRQVPTNYLTAGQEYLDSLRALGLVPAYLGWGWDAVTSHWVLVLVTPIIEAGGPLALNKLLFKAYNAGATPKDISPFIVRVFSPEVVAAAAGSIRSQFWLLGSKNVIVTPVPGRSNPSSRPTKVDNLEIDLLGIHLEIINSYESAPNAKNRAKSGYHDRRNEWQKFKKNVERLAA